MIAKKNIYYKSVVEKQDDMELTPTQYFIQDKNCTRELICEFGNVY